jgi:chromosome partitioning protein
LDAHCGWCLRSLRGDRLERVDLHGGTRRKSACEQCDGQHQRRNDGEHADVRRTGRGHQRGQLADALRPLESEFDTILIDAPSGFSLVALSVPRIAAELIVPTRAEYLALESLAQLLRWYRDLRASGAATAQLAGMLLTMVDYRRQATREIVHIVRLHNRRGVFRVEIPQDPRAAEAPSHGVPLVGYARSRAALAYEHFTGELLKRLASRR